MPRNGYAGLNLGLDSIQGRAAAGVTYTDEALLRTLATDPHDNVRAAVATNHVAPADSLTALAADAQPLVRARVAANPAAGPDALRLLAADPVDGIRCIAARHPHLDPAGILALAGDRVSLVRYWVSKRADLPADAAVLITLATPAADRDLNL